MVSTTIWFFLAMILLVFFVLKALSKKQEFVMRLTLFLFVFLLASVAYVYTATGTEIHSFEDFFHFGDVYFSWVFSIFGNTKAITADVVNQDWAVNQSSG